jgi:AbrB family looped-hinge helix DNA binding protein
MATEVEFTRMSTKGQIVIPKKLRAGFEDGTPFAVIRDRDTIILKQIKLPGITWADENEHNSGVFFIGNLYGFCSL